MLGVCQVVISKFSDIDTKIINEYTLGMNNGNECNILKERVNELDTIKYFILGVGVCLLIIIFIAIMAIIIFICGCCIVGVIIGGGAGVIALLGAIVSCITPSFYCCLKFSIKKQRKKDKDELLKGLLENQKESVEMDESLNNGLEKIDLSFFNVDYNDYKIEKDIGFFFLFA